jgi:hypothetical protein
MLRLFSSSLRQGNICSSRVPSACTPFRLTVTDQPNLGRPRGEVRHAAKYPRPIGRSPFVEVRRPPDCNGGAFRRDESLSPKGVVDTRNTASGLALAFTGTSHRLGGFRTAGELTRGFVRTGNVAARGA